MTYGPYPARVLDLHDGDTCHLNLDLGFGFQMGAYDFAGHPLLSCRVFGINAPELSTDAGKIALAFAQSIMPPGTIVSVLSHGWDKYGGRFDGSITLPDGTDYGTRMIDAGQAVPYP
jgi:endonuclease YncB( thermonuclease family)